jgi:hypothetical protein
MEEKLNQHTAFKIELIKALESCSNEW